MQISTQQKIGRCNLGNRMAILHCTQGSPTRKPLLAWKKGLPMVTWYWNWKLIRSLAQDWPKHIHNLVNTKILSKKKLGITDVKQTIQGDKHHRISTIKEHMRYNPKNHYTIEKYLERKHHHPSSATASLRSNKRHSKPNSNQQET